MVTNRLSFQVASSEVWSRFRDGLIVSCQAPAGTAINTPGFIAAQASTVEAAGAKAIRAEGLANIAAVISSVKIPVIGLVKLYDPHSKVYITPRVEDVLNIVALGAQIVAVDATTRTRWGGQTLESFYKEVKEHTDIPLLADIDSLESAQAAVDLGFDAVATTLSSYTDQPAPTLPNVGLVEALCKTLTVPVIAEGGFASPMQVKSAIESGAWAVCVGTAITNPYVLTQRFVSNAF